MSLPQKRTTVDDKAYELAKKLVSDVVSKLAKKAISYTSASPAGGVIGKVYGEYAKHFFDLYLSVSRSDKYWAAFRKQHEHLENFIRESDKLISTTPLPVLDAANLGFLFVSLLAPEHAKTYIQQQLELRKQIKEVVGHFDGMLRTFGLLDLHASKIVRTTSEFLDTAPNRNVFDRVFTHGNLTSEINSLCIVADKLVMASARLAGHRNRWAEIVNIAPRSAGSRAALARTCEEVGR